MPKYTTSPDVIGIGRSGKTMEFQNSIDPSSRWLVQKFGGTSVGKFAVNIAKDIVSYAPFPRCLLVQVTFRRRGYIDSNKVVIVCSARSGSTKALGTTNLLLRAASETLRRRPKTQSACTTPVNRSGIFGRTEEGSQSPPPSNPRGSEACPWGLTPITPQGEALPPFHATVDLIRQEHFNAARASVQDPGILQELETEIEKDCEWLRSFLYASQVSIYLGQLGNCHLFINQVIDEISLRSKDTIVGLGERLACKIMTAVLRDQGIDAEYVSLENIVPVADDLEADEDGFLDQEFYDRLSRAVGERVKQCGPRVPVVTGKLSSSLLPSLSLTLV